MRKAKSIVKYCEVYTCKVQVHCLAVCFAAECVDTCSGEQRVKSAVAQALRGAQQFCSATRVSGIGSLGPFKGERRVNLDTRSA